MEMKRAIVQKNRMLLGHVLGLRGLEILWVLKSAMFWGVSPYTPAEAHRRFGVAYGIHLQDRRVRREGN
jgi:hypothetical protein